MQAGHVPTQFVLAVDLPTERSLATDTAGQRLSRLVCDSGVPALWCGADARILAKLTKVGHEAALRIDHLLSPSTDRDASREVAQLMAECAAVRLRLCGTVIRADQTVLLETLSRHGVRYVRLSPSGVRLPFFAPQPLSKGIWQMPVAVHLPLPSRWFPGRPAKRALQVAQGERGLVVAAIDLAELAKIDRSAWQQLETFLPHLQKMRFRGSLQFASLAALADQLAATKNVAPAHSILRNAA
jgi:hypothetical protein